MAFKNGDRNQGMLLPQYIEDFVKEDNVVRVYDKIIESYTDNELGLEYDENQVGNSRYNPKVMLKLLVYSYSYGIRSSRKIERAIYDNMSFIWLIGGLKPDHKTISEFRRNNEKAIKRALKLVVRLCIRLDLIGGNYLFVDGTKIKGNASMSKSWTKKKIEKFLKKLDEHIDEILNEHKKNDDLESKDSSYVKTEVEEKVKELKELKKKINLINDKIESRNDNHNYNTTDEESIILNTKKGSIVGLNGQVTVDEKHGFIVSSDVVAKNNDFAQFSKQIENGNENLGKKCKGGVGDAGYSSIKSLKPAISEGIDVIVPSQRQIKEEKKERDNKKDKFSKAKFKYNKEEDNYICPKRHKLLFVGEYKIKKGEKVRKYLIENKEICLTCPFYGECTKSKRGRTVCRGEDDKLREKLEARYSSEEGKEKYKKRKYKVEPVFGHLKKNLGYNDFLLRGISGGNIEMLIFSVGFNIMKTIKILGVKSVLERIRS